MSDLTDTTRAYTGLALRVFAGVRNSLYAPREIGALSLIPDIFRFNWADECESR